MSSKENSGFKSWDQPHLPKRILAMRFHALGDLFISLSSLQHLKNNMPKGTLIDFITLQDFCDIPNNLDLFNRVYYIKGKNYKTQFLSVTPYLIQLKLKKYDVVLDLQNNKVSQLIRKIINPDCYSEFDRFSPLHACERTRNTISKAGFILAGNSYTYNYSNPILPNQILAREKFKIYEKLIVFNPAGAFENRNWEIEKYIDLGQALLKKYDNQVKFLIIGIEKIAEKAKSIQVGLPGHVINLVSKTSQSEAFGLLQKADLVITEDGALMHMSYLSQKKTIAILGSTRSDWANPDLPHTFFFTSDDLECGNCMLQTCKYHSNICVTRVTVADVLEKALLFLNS